MIDDRFREQDIKNMIDHVEHREFVIRQILLGIQRERSTRNVNNYPRRSSR